MLRWTWGILLAGLSGCQLVLGFEDHEPFPGGGGGAGAGAVTGTTATLNTTSTMGTSGGGGEGGQPVIVTFGTADPVRDAMTELTDLAVDQAKIYALSPGDDGIVVYDEGEETLQPLATGLLVGPRGLVYTGGQLFTTSVDEMVSICALHQVDPISGMPTVLISEAGMTNCYLAVGAEGSLAAASRSDEVHTREGGGVGKLIGKAYAGSSIPALVIDSGKYFWVDQNQGELLRTDGDTVQPQHNPPGNQVDTVATMSTPVDLAVRNGQVYVVGEAGVGRVAATANNGTFVILTASTDNPRGISVDATHVYWADGTSVRAVPIGAEGVVPTILYSGPETPNDTFSRGDAIFFTTQSGQIFKITKTVE